jgi:hypothetical protein
VVIVIVVIVVAFVESVPVRVNERVVLVLPCVLVSEDVLPSVVDVDVGLVVQRFSEAKQVTSSAEPLHVAVPQMHGKIVLSAEPSVTVHIGVHTLCSSSVHVSFARQSPYPPHVKG